MTKQEIYDRARDHLLAQGKKSMDPLTHRCLYRGPRGLKCAIGCLIPDEAYEPGMEMSISMLLMNYPEKMRRLGLVDVGVAFLRKLQLIHDEQPLHRWAERLADFAREHGLRP